MEENENVPVDIDAELSMLTMNQRRFCCSTRAVSSSGYSTRKVEKRRRI
jgi:hypothetical protein